MNLSDKQIRKLAENRYGNDINSYGKQRDGFVEGFKQAQQSLTNISCFTCVYSKEKPLKECLLCKGGDKYIKNLEPAI